MVQIYNIPKVIKNIVAYALSRFWDNGNQYNTHDSTYKNEIVSENNYNRRITWRYFPINYKLFDQYQQKDPSLMAKYRMGTY